MRRAHRKNQTYAGSWEGPFLAVQQIDAMHGAFGSKDFGKINLKGMFVENVKVADDQETRLARPRVFAESGDHRMMVIVHKFAVLAALECGLGGNDLVHLADKVAEHRLAGVG